MALLTVPQKKKSNRKDLLARIDMAQLLIDMGFSDVDPDAEEQLLFCLFHNDSATPSFSVNIEKKVFHCFSSACAVRGSAIALYALWKQISYEQAESDIQYLPTRRSITKLQKQLAKERVTMSTEFRLKVLTDFTLAMPLLSQSPYARVLENRRISRVVMDWFGLRAYDEKAASKFDPNLLFQAGIANIWRNVVFSKHPILFPFWLGNSVAFLQGRLAEDDPAKVKYLGARGTIPCMFNHGALFKSPERVFITEGVIDAVSLAELGYGPALGIVGTEGFKPEWAKEFRGVKEVWIATDNDAAGQAAYLKLTGYLQDHVKRVERFVFPSEFNDINELLQSKEKK